MGIGKLTHCLTHKLMTMTVHNNSAPILTSISSLLMSWRGKLSFAAGVNQRPKLVGLFLRLPGKRKSAILRRFSTWVCALAETCWCLFTRSSGTGPRVPQDMSQTRKQIYKP